MTDTTTTDVTADDALRDPKIERWLNEHGVTWTFEPRFDLAKIDRKASHANQARDEAVNNEIAEKYTADMADGDQFPPIVVRKRARSHKVVTIDGNHRVEAADRNRAPKADHHGTLPAYVVDCADELALALTFEANRHHGLPPSEAERIGHALSLVAIGTVTITEAARRCGVPPNKVMRVRDIRAADDRARRLDVPKAFTVLSADLRYTLGRIRSDDVFAETARFTLDAALPAMRVRDLCKRLDKARSDRDALALLGEEQDAYRHEIEQRAGGHRVRNTVNPRIKLQRLITDLHLLDPTEVAAACAGPDQVTELRRRLKEATDTLIRVDQALKARR